MADGWRELARWVPGIMLRAGTVEPHISMELAINRLGDARREVRGFRLRTTPAANDDFVNQEPAEVVPAAILEDVRVQIDGAMALHGKAGHLLSLCFDHLGVEPDQWLCFQQEICHESACHSAWEALKRIQAASSSATASQDAVAIARTFPVGDPLYHAWMMAAEQALNDATDEAVDTIHDMWAMRRDVARQFILAWGLCVLIAAGLVP